jgi:hypothetical protein
MQILKMVAFAAGGSVVVGLLLVGFWNWLEQCKCTWSRRANP